MTLRQLRVLHLDDQRDDVERPLDEEPSTLTGLPRTIDPFVILDAKGSVSAIKGWRTAQRVWMGMGAVAPPDLVISDVLFEEDPDTPLSRVPGLPGREHPIPTGLGHVKPFAAVARAVERPIGIALHTRNANIWAAAWEAGHPMGALAAHEIGELAAILGDEVCGTTIEESVERCWTWLRGRSRDYFDPALFIAMSDYRRRLVEATRLRGIPGQEVRPSVLVLPQDWVRLANWVTEQAKKNNAHLDLDLGVPLVYSNGERDCIRLVSLFGEVERIDSDAFPAACFASSTNEKIDRGPWDLDDQSYPQIGRFIMALGSVANAYLQALKLGEEFPMPARKLERNLRTASEGVPDRNLVMGLGVLFQTLRWEYSHHARWLDGLELQGWSFFDKRISESEAEGTCLGEVLEVLASHARAFRKERFCRSELPALTKEPTFDLFSIDQANEGPVRWHFARLVDAGVLSYFPGDDSYLYRHALRKQEIPAPPTLPTGFPGAELGQIKMALRDSLGFGKRFGPNKADNDHAINQILANAFIEGGDEADGCDFHDRLLDGQGPPWLLELLRQYALDVLDWQEERTWPIWLRKAS